VVTEPYDNQKRFMEEMILRFEKAFQRVSRSMDVMDARIERNTAAVEAMTIEFREEMQAQRQALLHVLDRLNGENGPPRAA